VRRDWLRRRRRRRRKGLEM